MATSDAHEDDDLEALMKELEGPSGLTPDVAEPSVIAAPDSASPEAMNFYRMGEASVAESNWDEAMMNFSLALSIDECFAKAHFARAKVFSSQDQHDGAIRDMQHAAIFAPKDPEMAFGMYEVCKKASKQDEARAALAEAVRIDPGHVKGLIERAQMLFDSGSFREALPDFKAAFQADSSNREAVFRAALCHERLDEDTLAAKAFGEARRLKTDDPEAPAHLSVLYFKMEQYAASQKAVRITLALKSDHPLAVSTRKKLDELFRPALARVEKVVRDVGDSIAGSEGFPKRSRVLELHKVLKHALLSSDRSRIFLLSKRCEKQKVLISEFVQYGKQEVLKSIQCCPTPKSFVTLVKKTAKPEQLLVVALVNGTEQWHPEFADLSAKYEDVMFVKVEEGENKVIVDRFGVLLFPSYVFYKSGEEISEMLEEPEEGELEERIKELLQ